MKMYNRFLSITLAMLLLLGCSKELSVETGGSGLPGSGGGGNAAADYGWTFTGRTADNYRGCIDSAFYQAVGPGKALYIYGTDSAGNTFVLSMVSTTSRVNAGTYSLAQGATMVLQDNAGNTFLPKPPSPFSLQLTRVNDTIAEGNFSGTLTNSVSNTTINISNGKFKALIGKENPCGITGGGPGGGTDAEFTLVSSGTTCSNPFIDGEYYKSIALDASHTVELDVKVTKPGDWTITTPTINGMVFTGSGTFTQAGSNTIELIGSGTPTTAGNNIIPLQAGSSSCNFTITVETTIVAVPGTGDYFPTTSNSNWTYYLTDLSTSDEDSILTTSTGANITVGGQTYAVFDNDPFDAAYRKANGIYYRYGPLDYVGILDTTFKKIEYIFLKDNVAVGASWESPVVDGVFVTSPVKYKKVFTIVEKNVSMVVKGVIYNNVITVSEKTMIGTAGTPFQKLEETFVSYAKGIGMINAVNEDIFDVKVELKRFRVF